jgi:dihydrofolate synthase/folylpolyglutamate synthase
MLCHSLPMTLTYAEAIKFLYELQWFGTRFGLESPRQLAALAGSPHERLRFVHVAGTNGKGSTCAMLESVYRAAGLRVGLFTSPHLVAFGERIQVNRRPIPNADVARLADEMRRLLAKFPAETHPTFFEVVTVMALRYFEEQECDLVIWETGLGGRLDATNIVTPLASVITNIQFDHQQWLGDTLERIATEKAGIIKPGVPLLTAVNDADAFRVLFRTAHDLGAPFWLVTEGLTEQGPLRGLDLPLAGAHQRLNAALAAYTVKTLSGVIPVDEQTVRAGLARVDWPGRLQMVGRPGGRRILLDGAHNTGGARALRAALADTFAVHDPVLIIGILNDKDTDPICRILAPGAGRILTVPVKSRRSASPEDLAAFCREANPRAGTQACASLEEALDAAADAPLVVVAGSLYLIGEAMELLGLAADAPANERNLNEWSPAGMQARS